MQPIKSIYLDLINTWYPDPTLDIRQAADSGYNVIILSFYLLSGPADVVYAWTNIASEDQRTATLKYIHDKGSILLMSCGGATDEPYETKTGKEYGELTAEVALKYGFDGVDYDLEGFSPGLTYGTLNSQEIIDWLTDCTLTARQILGSDKYITHAP